MERPRSVSTLALILTLLGLSSLGALAALPWNQPFPVAPQLLRTDPAIASRVMLSAGAIYAVAAVISAFALWRMRLWAPLAYLAFTASILVYVSLFLYLVRAPGWIALGAGLVGVLVAGLYWGWRIVHRVFAPLLEKL